MIVQFFSDLHLEFFNEYKLNGIFKHLEPKSEILFICGDIGNILKNNNLAFFLKDVAKKFKKIYYVCGNHEYYDYNKKYKDKFNSFLEWEYFIHTEMNKVLYENIHLFNNKDLVTQFYNFNIYGCTFWSKLDFNFKIEIESNMNDFFLIPSMNFDSYLENFQNQFFNLNFLLNESDSSNKNIILTHHLPILPEINNYNDYILKSAYGTQMEDFNFKNLTWFAGHTHKKILKTNYEFGNLFTNPIGYKGENINQNKLLNSLFNF